MKRLELDDGVMPQMEKWKDYLIPRASEGTEIKLSEQVFRRMTPPRKDRPHPKSQIFSMLQGFGGQPEVFLMLDLLGVDELRNALCFEPGNVIHWHTNSEVPGKRVYYVFNEVAGSLFAYKDDQGNLIYEEEPEGWIAREFTVPDPDDSLFWHAVWAKGHRVSIGFLAEED